MGKPETKLFPLLESPSLHLGEVQEIGAHEEVGTMSLQQRLKKEQEQKRNQAASKSDDAPIPLYLWDSRLVPDLVCTERSHRLQPLRLLALCWWRCRTNRDFLGWIKSQYPSIGQYLSKTLKPPALYELLRDSSVPTAWTKSLHKLLTLGVRKDWDLGRLSEVVC